MLIRLWGGLCHDSRVTKLWSQSLILSACGWNICILTRRFRKSLWSLVVVRSSWLVPVVFSNNFMDKPGTIIFSYVYNRLKVKRERWTSPKINTPIDCLVGDIGNLIKPWLLKKTTTRRRGLHESWSGTISTITTWEVEEGSTKIKWKLHFICLQISRWKNYK